MEYQFIQAKLKTSKPPVLFLHGWGGDKNSFAFIKPFLEDRDLWFISFAGHGKTPEPQTPMSVADFAAELKEFINEHNLNGADLVAHSFGGRVALVLAGTNEHMFSRLLLTGCAGLKPKRGIKLRAKILAFKIKKWLVRLHILSPKVLENSGSEEYRVLSPVMRETFKKVVNENLKKYAKRIKNPTLLVWGKKDTATPMFMGKKLNKYIKNSELVVMDKLNHFCFYQQPTKFALILRYFFV